MSLCLVYLELIINQINMKKLIFTLLALVVTFSSFSQRNPDATYLSAFVYTPKDGMREKFEAAAAKKTQMFNN